MTPEQAIKSAAKGELAPVYVVVGPEGFLRDQVVRAIRKHADTGVPGFNEDKFNAGETSADAVVGAALHLPMMAPLRLVLLRGVDRWDKKSGDKNLDVIASYASSPVDTTVLVIEAPKINGSRKLMKIAKKAGFVVSCEALKRRELPRWIRERAKAMGHDVNSSVADALAELSGPELGAVCDALERLSLYVGEGGTIDEAALSAVVTRVRQDTVWMLVDAVAARDLGKSLASLDDAFDTRDKGPQLIGTVAWRVRQLIKFKALLGRGASKAEAGKAAGVPGFKVSDLERTVRRLTPQKLERWLMLLGEADLAVKGSRRPGQEVLATMLVDMCD